MGKKTLETMVDDSMSKAEKRLIEIITEKQGTKGYIDTQVPDTGGKPRIRAYWDLQNGDLSDMTIVGVRVRDGLIEFIAEPSDCCPTYSEEDFVNNENWNGDFVNGEYLYYETIINIANAIEQY
jgi:hypothetical protein